LTDRCRWFPATPSASHRSNGGQQLSVHKVRSQHSNIYVEDEGACRVLYFGDNAESRINRSDPLKGGLKYAEHFHCAFLLNPHIHKVLFIGLGGGTGPTQFLRCYPRVQVDVAEIDPAVIRIAREYFALTDNRRIRIVEADGRVFVRRTRRQYDLIVVDAYLTKAKRNLIPPHLTTLEFFSEAKARLSERGAICYNVIGMPYGITSAMPRAIARTMKCVFPAVHAFDVKPSENTVLIATQHRPRVNRSILVARAQRYKERGSIPFPQIVKTARNYCDRPLDIDSAYLLTDDDAPVAQLLEIDE